MLNLEVRGPRAGCCIWCASSETRLCYHTCSSFHQDTRTCIILKTFFILFWIFLRCVLKSSSMWVFEGRVWLCTRVRVCVCVRVCVLVHHTWDVSIRAAEQTKVFFSPSLLLTLYILWTLFSKSYWSRSPQRSATIEKNGVCVCVCVCVLLSLSFSAVWGQANHREQYRVQGKPYDLFKWNLLTALSPLTESQEVWS